MTSSVIDHLNDSLQPEEGLAFYYCRRSGDKLEDPKDIIRSIFRQLATRAFKANSHQMRKDVQYLFSKSKDDMSHPEISICKLQILNSIDQYSRITLVIDALDECAEPKKELFDLIESMTSQSKCPVRVFVSARPNFGVEDRFLEKSTIKTGLDQVESDIERFILHEIAEFPKWNLISEKVQLDAIDSLKQKSEGMFQWVSLHVEQLRSCEMDDDVLLFIEKMPKGLQATYRQIYDQISIHPSQKAIVDRAFLWLMYSTTTMDTDSVLEAIRYDANHDQAERKIDKDKLLTLCKNLVVLDESADRFRFCHASVSEYIADRLWLPATPHCYTAKVCLRLLLIVYSEPTETMCNSNRPGLGEVTSDNKARAVMGSVTSSKNSGFHHHCNCYWFDYVQRYEDTVPDQSRLDATLISLLKLFLNSPFQSGQVYESWHFDAADFFVETLYEDISPSRLPILAMCRLAIGTSLLAEWWSTLEEIPSQMNGDNESLLILAVQGDSLQICETLVRANAPLDHLGSNFSALHHAVNTGNIDIARLLLENGANVDQADNLGQTTPVMVAIQNENFQMVQFLLAKGANINCDLPNYRNALVASMDDLWEGESLELASFLIKRGADANMTFTGFYGSALAAAAHSGNPDIITLLINHGADVNKALTGIYGSALAAAAHRGSPDIITLLINHGADVNLPLVSGVYGSALHAACNQRHITAVRALLDAGAIIYPTQEHAGFKDAFEAVEAWAEIRFRTDITLRRPRVQYIPRRNDYKTSSEDLREENAIKQLLNDYIRISEST